jgi:hypothetical protein
MELLIFSAACGVATPQAAKRRFSVAARRGGA